MLPTDFTPFVPWLAAAGGAVVAFVAGRWTAAADDDLNDKLATAGINLAREKAKSVDLEDKLQAYERKEAERHASRSAAVTKANHTRKLNREAELAGVKK